MRFKLLRGEHQQAKHPQVLRMDLSARSVEELKKLAKDLGESVGEEESRDSLVRVLRTSSIYKANDSKRNIVPSDVDLEARFGPQKFQNLDRLYGDQGPGADALQRRIEELEAENARLKAESREEEEGGEEEDEETPDLDSMNVADLKQFADDNEIELEPGLRKQEIVEAIKYDLESR